MSSDLLFRRDFWSACRINSFSAIYNDRPFTAPRRTGMVLFMLWHVPLSSLFGAMVKPRFGCQIVMLYLKISSHCGQQNSCKAAS